MKKCRYPPMKISSHMLGTIVSTMPISAKPISAKPISVEPISLEPISEELISEEPVSEKRVSSELSSTKSISAKSILKEPISAKPVSSRPDQHENPEAELIRPRPRTKLQSFMHFATATTVPNSTKSVTGKRARSIAEDSIQTPGSW